MRGQPSPNGCGLRNIMRYNGIHRTGARFAARMLAPAIVAGLLAPLAVATGAQARDQIVSLSVAQSKSIRVSKGKPQTIRTDAAFYEIVIGDTEIANVNPLTDKSFYVLGNKLGTTGIALFDEPLPPGFVGENLAIEGVLEPGVWVGDTLHFPRCVLRVTAPREPCFKFNAVMGFAQAARLMVREARCGFYLAVEQPGTLVAGEAFVLRPGPRALSITEAIQAKWVKHRN